jgi:polar amino acid transport system substrate-binding protein
MKKFQSTPRHSRRLLTGLLLVAVVALTGCTSSASSQPTGTHGSLYSVVIKRGVLRVGVRPDDPPHSFLNSQGKYVGFDVDIATAIAQDWGVKLQLVPVNELTRFSFVQNGRIDLAVTSISKTVQRAEEVDFSETYYFSDQTILVQKGKYQHLADLIGKSIAVDRGSNAGDNWLAWLKSHGHASDTHLETFGNKQASLNAVQTGAVAGYVEDYELLAALAKNNPKLSIINDPGGVGVKLDGVAMHKNDSLLTLKVNLALQHIASSGEYDQIYNRWFGPSSSTPVPLMGHIEVWPNG